MSLKEKMQQRGMVIEDLQKTVEQKQAEIQKLSHQIATIEGQLSEQTHTEDGTELQLKAQNLMFMKLADLKMNIIQLQDEVDQLRTTLKLSQKEASCYQEHTTSLLAATNTPIQVRSCVRRSTHAH